MTATRSPVAGSGPVAPLPAATVVLLRDGAGGLEVLLLRRSERAAFVPGAYVFPGGRVDTEDCAPDVLAKVRNVTAERAAERLGLSGVVPPALAYYVAAAREAFEETGILAGVRHDGRPAPPPRDEELGVVRVDLLAGRLRFADALTRVGCWVAGAELVYFAHWITPVSMPRRFDTRFFAAAVRGAVEPVVDGREIVAARWITPAAALHDAAAGALPMILPTISTLELLTAHADARAALAALASTPVATILPDPG